MLKVFIRDFLGKERSSRENQKQISFLSLADFRPGTSKKFTSTLVMDEKHLGEEGKEEAIYAARKSALRVSPGCGLSGRRGRIKERRKEGGKKYGQRKNKRRDRGRENR